MSLLETLRRLIVGPEAESVPSLGRNDRCWCGSDRKYKFCHMAADDRKRTAARASGRTSPAGF